MFVCFLCFFLNLWRELSQLYTKHFIHNVFLFRFNTRNWSCVAIICTSTLSPSTSLSKSHCKEGREWRCENDVSGQSNTWTTTTAAAGPAVLSPTTAVLSTAGKLGRGFLPSIPFESLIFPCLFWGVDSQIQGIYKQLLYFNGVIQLNINFYRQHLVRELFFERICVLSSPPLG